MLIFIIFYNISKADAVLSRVLLIVETLEILISEEIQLWGLTLLPVQ